MQTKTERNLNEIFDVDPIPEEAKSDLVPMDDEEVPNYRPSNFNPNRIEEQENEELKTDMATDYDVARSNYKDLIRHGESLLELVMSTAQATEDPKHIDAASKVIGQLANLNSKLLELTQRKQDVYNKTRTTEIIKNSLSNDNQNGQTLDDIPEEASFAINNVTNNVQFVGTSADLAKLINEVKNENIADK